MRWSVVYSFAWLVSQTASIIPASQFSNIIVIADMHGDAEALLLSIYAGYVKLVRTSDNHPHQPVSFREFADRFDSVIELNPTHAFNNPLWTQKNVALVQLGDLIDRGKYSLKCLLIMRAVRAVLGFEVFQIMGNHELAPAIDTTTIYAQYLHPSDDLNWGLDPHLIQRPDGVLYKEILNRFTPMVRLDGGENRNISTLFVHAGVPIEFIIDLGGVPLPSDPNELVRSINQDIKDSLMTPSLTPQFLLETLLHDKTIFTSREYAKKFPNCEEIETILNVFKVSRIVVGHMADAQSHRARNFYCNNQPVIVLADIAASRYMSGFDSDKKLPSPGAIVMKINPRLNTLEYMEGVYSNYWGSLLSGPPQSLITPKVNTPIPVSDVRRLGPIIAQDELVKIMMFQSRDKEGFVLRLTKKGSRMIQPGLDRLEEMRNAGDTFFDSFPNFERIQIQNVTFLYIESPRSYQQIPLRLFQEPITPDIVDQMDNIISLLTEEEICTGLIRDGTESQLKDYNWIRNYFKNLFVISRDGQRLTFVNFSRLHPCDEDDAKAEQMTLFEAFDTELNL